MTDKTTTGQEAEKATVPAKPHYTLVVHSAKHTPTLTKQEDKPNG